jgi:hypothetical protein
VPEAVVAPEPIADAEPEPDRQSASPPPLEVLVPSLPSRVIPGPSGDTTSELFVYAVGPSASSLLAKFSESSLYY